MLVVSCSPKGVAQLSYVPADKVTAKTSSYSYAGALDEKFGGNGSAALDMLLFTIEVDSTNAAAYSELSSYSLFLKNNAGARSFLEKAVRYSPENVWYKYKLADFLARNDSISEAVAVYEDILKSKSDDSSLYYILSAYYVKLKEYSKALDLLEKLQAREGDDIDLFMQKLKIYDAMGDDARIISELEERIHEKPDDVIVRTLLAQMYVESGQTSKAESLYSAILEKNPYDAEINASILILYESNDMEKFRNKINEIISETSYSMELKDYALTRVMSNDSTKNDSIFLDSLFDRLIPTLPSDDTAILIRYAQYLQLMGRTERMIPVLEEVFRRDPSIEIVNHTLFSYYLEEGDGEKVSLHAAQGIKNSPQQLYYYFYSSIGYLEKKDYDTVIDICSRALPYIGKDSSTELVAYIYSVMASAYHEKGMTDESLQACEKALMYSPNDPTMLNDYAYFLAIAGRELDKAEDMAKKALGFRPDDINIIDTYAWVLFVKQDYALALEYIEKALSLSDNPGDTLYEHAGDIYIMSGMEEKAVEMWKKAKEAGSESATIDRKIKLRKYIKGE